jgi:hypothetical protein
MRKHRGQPSRAGRWPRAVLELVSRRVPDGPEAGRFSPGATILERRVAGVPVQLAMAGETLTGFLSWLEARPPRYTMPDYVTG